MVDPVTILQAINAAKAAIDAAVKVKTNFFDSPSESKSSLSSVAKGVSPIDALEVEVNQQKKLLSELLTEVTENRTIIEKQNEIIIEAVNALKITAETVRLVRMISLVAIGLAAVASIASLYLLAR